MEKENIQEYTMNMQPELGRWAAWRKERNLKAIARIEEKAVTKQINKEMVKAGIITKKEVRKAYAYSIAHGIVTLGLIALAATTSFTALAFIIGIGTAFSGFALVANIKDTIKKHKEYRKENPKTKQVKPKKEKKKKDKKLGLVKRVKNVFTKFKNKTDNSNEQPIKEEPIVTPTPVETQQKPIIPQPEISESKETIANYQLDPNGPKVATVDLSNISMKPGLDVNIQHFVVRKDDEIMQELISQYIEKTTGCPAIYADRVIDNEEKRVYMITK